MTLTEYITLSVYMTLTSEEQTDCKQITSLAQKYDNTMIRLPKVICADGFSISVQASNGHYCSTENGYRKYGKKFQKVEWGFPSERIDAKFYNADVYDDNEDTRNCVGSCELYKLEQLMYEHGEIDLEATLFKDREI